MRIEFYRNTDWRLSHRVTWMPNISRFITYHRPPKIVITIIWLVWVLHLVKESK